MISLLQLAINSMGVEKNLQKDPLECFALSTNHKKLKYPVIQLITNTVLIFANKRLSNTCLHEAALPCPQLCLAEFTTVVTCSFPVTSLALLSC